MSVSAAQAEAFYAEAIASSVVFAVNDGDGFPAPKNGSGRRAIPFWSKRSRAQKVIDNVPAYAGMTVVEIALEQWLSTWMHDLTRAGLDVGLNWSGKNATGYDVAPADVVRNLEARGVVESMRGPS